MYSLTCPSCEHRARSPFIRLGAVVKCASCGTKIQIRAENVRRQVKIKPQYDNDDLFTVPVVDRAIEEELSTPAAAESTPPPAPESMADLAHEHSHDHAHEHDHGPEHSDSHSPHLDEIAAATKPNKRPRSKAKAKVKAKAKAKVAAQQRNNMSAVYIGGGAVLAVVLIIVAIMMLTGGSNDPAKDSTTDGATDGTSKDTLVNRDGTKDGTNINKDSTFTKDSRPPNPKDNVNKDANVKKDGKSKDGKNGKTKDGKTKDGSNPVPPIVETLKAETLGDLAWQNQSTSFQPAIPASMVTLNNVARKTTDSGATFTADVAVQQMVVSAIVQLALVNEEDRVYARFVVPVAMLDAKQPRKLQIDIPTEYLTALEHLHWEVSDVSSPTKQMVMLVDGLGQFVKQNSDAEVRISARNPDSRELTKAGFVLAAMDIDGRMLGQWKLDYTKPIGPSRRVEFVASVPMPRADKVTRWAVYAAGLPSNAPAVVPNINTPPKPDPDDRNPRPIRPSGRGIFDF